MLQELLNVFYKYTKYQYRQYLSCVVYWICKGNFILGSDYLFSDQSRAHCIKKQRLNSAITVLYVPNIFCNSFSKMCGINKILKHIAVKWFYWCSFTLTYIGCSQAPHSWAMRLILYLCQESTYSVPSYLFVKGYSATKIKAQIQFIFC